MGYGPRASDTRRITAAEIKYMRRTAVYTWTDYKTNEKFTKELKITPILTYLVAVLFTFYIKLKKIIPAPKG